MANKQALRELQNRLALRMQQVRTEAAGVLLAVDSGGQGLLLALRQIGEIAALGELLPVPHTRPWLAGVVNLRGGVCAVVDLARFLGLRPAGNAARHDHARLLVFHGSFGLNGALLVDRLEGLRHAADLRVEPESADNDGRPAFALARWRDGAGKLWQELDLAELARQPQFLAITG